MNEQRRLWRELARHARELLDTVATLTPEKVAQMSPAEQRMIRDMFTPENCATLRELADGKWND
jgi:hypothetical protein